MAVTDPLRLTNTAEAYDIDATIDGGGVSGQARALRLGIARALCLLDPELRPTLKRSGLLTRNAREKESKKYGLKKARKAPQYSKRSARWTLPLRHRRGPRSRQRRADRRARAGARPGERQGARCFRFPGRPRHASIGAAPPERLRRRAGHRGRRRGRRGRAPHPGARLAGPLSRCAGGGRLRLAQPLRRQRDQAVQRPGNQAGLGHRARHREGARLAVRAAGAPAAAAERRGRRGDHRRPHGGRRVPQGAGRRGRRAAGSTASTSSSIAPTGRPARWPPRSSSPSGRGSRWCSTTRTGSTSTTGAGRPTPKPSPRWSSSGRRSSASPSTVTPTGWWRWTTAGAVADGDHLLVLFAIDLADRGLLDRGDSVVVTVMSNLGFRLAMAQRNIFVGRDPRRGPGGPRRARRGRVQPRRRAVGPHRVPAPGRPPATGSSPALLLADLIVPVGRSALPPVPPADRAGPPGPVQRGRPASPTGSPGRPRSGGPCARSSWPSGRVAGCSCGRAAPSRDPRHGRDGRRDSGRDPPPTVICLGRRGGAAAGPPASGRGRGNPAPAPPDPH